MFNLIKEFLKFINTVNKLQNQINEYEIMQAIMKSFKTHVQTQESNYWEVQEK